MRDLVYRWLVKDRKILGLIHQFIEFLPHYFLKLFRPFFDPLVFAVIDKIRSRFRDELYQCLRVIGQFSCDLEPLILGFHEMAVEAFYEGLIILL